jgi:fatty-acyl-CoA synthase
VVDAVVVGAADERWGEVVTAVVQPVSGDAPTLDELAAHCRAQLAPFKVPRRLVLVEVVHRSASGKPDYRWARSTVD